MRESLLSRTCPYGSSFLDITDLGHTHCTDTLIHVFAAVQFPMAIPLGKWISNYIHICIYIYRYIHTHLYTCLYIYINIYIISQIHSYKYILHICIYFHTSF